MTIILGSPRAGMSVSSMWDDSGLFELVTKHEGRHPETGKQICVVDSFPFKQDMHPTFSMGKSQLMPKPNATYELDTESRFPQGGITVHMVDEAHIAQNNEVDAEYMAGYDISAPSKHPKSNRRAKTKAERASIKAKRKQKRRGR